MIISPAIMQEIDKIKEVIGFDTIKQCNSKTTNSIYFYLFKKSEYRFYQEFSSLAKKKEITSGFLKIRISDHIGKKKSDIDIVTNGTKSCVFFNQKLIGG